VKRSVMGSTGWRVHVVDTVTVTRTVDVNVGCEDISPPSIEEPLCLLVAGSKYVRLLSGAGP